MLLKDLSRYCRLSTGIAQVGGAPKGSLSDRFTSNKQFPVSTRGVSVYLVYGIRLRLSLSGRRGSVAILTCSDCCVLGSRLDDRFADFR